MTDETSRGVYRAPDSNLVDGSSTSNNADNLFVGKNYEEYYRQKFEHFDSTGKKASWNWVSFFFTWPWLLYRKMWLNSFIYILVVPTILLVIAGILGMLIGSVGLALYLFFSIIVCYVLAPIFSNWLYYSHARKKIATVESLGQHGTERAAELTRRGGTSMIGLVLIGALLFIAVLGILAAIAIPAYSSYVQKAKFTEVIQSTTSTKLDIDACYSEKKSLAECDGPYDLSGIVESSAFVSGLDVVEGTAEIVSTGSDDVGGHTFVLQPVITDQGLQWETGGSCIDVGLC